VLANTLISVVLTAHLVVRRLIGITRQARTSDTARTYPQVDEPMAHQFIQFGSFCFDVKQNVMKAGNIDFIATMPTSIIFRGANLSKEKEICQFKKPPDIRSKLMIGSNFIDVSC
jgi:hypothetical protein